MPLQYIISDLLENLSLRYQHCFFVRMADLTLLFHFMQAFNNLAILCEGHDGSVIVVLTSITRRGSMRRVVLAVSMVCAVTVKVSTPSSQAPAATASVRLRPQPWLSITHSLHHTLHDCNAAPHYSPSPGPVTVCEIEASGVTGQYGCDCRLAHPAAWSSPLCHEQHM